MRESVRLRAFTGGDLQGKVQEKVQEEQEKALEGREKRPGEDLLKSLRDGSRVGAQAVGEREAVVGQVSRLLAA